MCTHTPDCDGVKDGDNVSVDVNVVRFNEVNIGDNVRVNEGDNVGEKDTEEGTRK